MQLIPQTLPLVRPDFKCIMEVVIMAWGLLLKIILFFVCLHHQVLETDHSATQS